MEHHLNRSMLDNFEVNNVEHIQQEISKMTNIGAIRSIENGALHFITVPRDQEFIDHSLLNPEYLAQFPNGFIVDLIPSADGDQQTQQMISETINTDLTFQGDEQDRRLTAAFLQLVNKQCHIKIGNEAQVIVANKDMAITEDSKTQIIHHNFATINNHQSIPQNSVIDHNFKIYQQPNQIQSQVNPPLPPLTPIRRLTRQRNNSIICTQQITPKKVFDIQSFKEIEPNVDEEIDICQRPLAKKSLPHKKRITKKLRTIDKIEPPPPRQTVIYQDIKQNTIHEENNIPPQSNNTFPQFSCELCSAICNSQIDFFTHLKCHYEPEPVAAITSNQIAEVSVVVAANQPDAHTIDLINFAEETIDNIKIEDSTGLNSKEDNVQDTQDSATHAGGLHIDEVEFSDTEDMLEGIRGVVDKVQESVGNDSNDENDWYSNSSLNGNLSYKNDENNQNLNTSVENFSMFFKSNLDKTNESQEFITSVGEEDHKLENATDMMSNEPYDISEELETKPELDSSKSTHIELENMMVNDEKNNEVLKVTPTRPQRNRKPKIKQIVDDDFSDQSMDGMSSDDDKCSKRRRRKCTQCDKVFNSSNALKYHELSHTGERPHQCDVCGKSFFAQSALKVHMRLHSGDKPYECEFCKRAFRQWGDLKYHTISLHTNERNFQCEFCGKAFARRYSLVIHRRIHTSERNYKCEFCPKTFRASSYLQNHRKVHTGEKPYTCGVCGKKFRVSGDLKRHSNIHGREKKKKGESSLTPKVEVMEKISSSEQIVQFIKPNLEPPPQLIKSESNILMDLSLLHEELNNPNSSIIKIEQQGRTNNLNGTGAMIYSNESVQIFKTESDMHERY